MAREKLTEQHRNARAMLGTQVRERPDGKYVVVNRYDGTTVSEHETPDAAYKAQGKKK